MYNDTNATSKNTVSLLIDATLMVFYALSFPVNLQRISDAMINAYLYNFRASGNYASIGSYDDWIAVTYENLFHYLDLENTFDRDIGAFTYLWQMIAGAN